MKKIGNQSGFTLAETLMAVLILLLVSGIVAQGIPVAQNVYNKVVLGANTQVMLSTAVAELRDKLGTAWKVRISSDGNTITCFSADSGSLCTLTFQANNSIMYKEYESVEALNNRTASSGYALVSNTSSDMYVTCKPTTGTKAAEVKAEDNEKYVLINGLSVCKKVDNTVLSTLKDESGNAIPMKIRVISGDVEGPTT